MLEADETADAALLEAELMTEERRLEAELAAEPEAVARTDEALA